MSLRVMLKIVNATLKAKAKAWTFKAKAKAIGVKVKAIKFDVKGPRGQGLVSRTTSLTLSCFLKIISTF